MLSPGWDYSIRREGGGCGCQCEKVKPRGCYQCNLPATVLQQTVRPAEIFTMNNPCAGTAIRAAVARPELQSSWPFAVYTVTMAAVPIVRACWQRFVLIVGIKP
jgi:hypothetical protein